MNTQYVIDALIEQRNNALNALAMLNAELKDTKEQLEKALAASEVKE